MKTRLYTAERVACGEIPEHSPMIRDPAQVDCERCRRTAVFRKTATAAPVVKREPVKFEQKELF